MRRSAIWGLLIATLIASPLAQAQVDRTTDLLEARYVKQYVRVTFGPRVAGKPIKLLYAVDSVNDLDYAELEPGITFRSSGPIQVLLGDFNPLLQKYQVEQKATADVSYAAIKQFLEDLKEFQKALPSQPLTGGGGTATDPCDILEGLITGIETAAKDPELTADSLKSIVDAAHGYSGSPGSVDEGVHGAVTNLTRAKKQITDNVDTIEKNLKRIRDEFTADLGARPQHECTSDLARAKALADRYRELRDKITPPIITSKKGLAASIDDLLAFLATFDDDKAWAGPNKSDYRIDAVKPTFEEMKTVTIHATAKKVSLVNDKIVVTEVADTKVDASFDVRRSSFFVPERAAAMIYNRLTYPVYGTATDPDTGKTVVKRNDDHQPVGGAMMLNLVMRVGGGSVAYPMLQFGVSSAKDFPGFLAGAGFRFTRPVAFSISFGGMITRFKDLDEGLHVGDVVTGTADIDKHLKFKTSDIATYGAIQIKF